MRKKILPLFLLLCLALLAPFARPAAAQEAIVHAVLFYSPSCGHCEKLINEDLPPIANKYQDQLQLIGVDVSQAGGAALYQAAVTYYKVPDDRLGVPLLVVNDTVLVGGAEIPQQFPLIIDDTLKAGGNDWPGFPGLKEAIAAAGGTPGAPAEAPAEQPAPGMIGNFLRDPLANSIAVAVLLAMLLVVVVVVLVFLRSTPLRSMHAPDWLIPALAFAGIFIAGYMTYVEITKAQAICGPVGDCNTVQESPYATLFGFLPVGILGLLGYAGILAAWGVLRFGPANLRKLALQALWYMGWFGIIFSIYLTFLEPFVIGASCAWCISSAIVITLVFWFSTGMMKEVWGEDQDEDDLDEDELDEASAQSEYGDVSGANSSVDTGAANDVIGEVDLKPGDKPNQE